MSSLPPVAFHWIRHAPVDHGGLFYGGGTDLPAQIDLSLERWANLAARLPRGVSWVASGLSRAAATAEALMALRGDSGPPAREPRFDEQRFGEWEGRPFDEVFAEGGGTWAGLTARLLERRPPGGESFRDVAARVAAGAEALRARGPGPFAVVSHAGAVRAALAVARPDLPPGWALEVSVEPLAMIRTTLWPDAPGGPRWSVDLDGLAPRP